MEEYILRTWWALYNLRINGHILSPCALYVLTMPAGHFLTCADVPKVARGRLKISSWQVFWLEIKILSGLEHDANDTRWKRCNLKSRCLTLVAFNSTLEHKKFQKLLITFSILKCSGSQEIPKTLNHFYHSWAHESCRESWSLWAALIKRVKQWSGEIFGHNQLRS